MESQGFSEELTERAWLQLLRSCALHTHHCPNFWKAGLTGCRYSKEYCKDRNGAPRSSKEDVETGGSGNNFIIFKLENASGDS